MLHPVIGRHLTMLKITKVSERRENKKAIKKACPYHPLGSLSEDHLRRLFDFEW